MGEESELEDSDEAIELDYAPQDPTQEDEIVIKDQKNARKATSIPEPSWLTLESVDEEILNDEGAMDFY